MIEKTPFASAELAALYEAIRRLNSSLSLTETLDVVIDALMELTGAERSCLMLLGEQGDLRIQAARHFDRKSVADLDLSHTVVAETVRQGQPIITTNAQLDPRFSEQESVVGYQLRSIACLPLLTRRQVIGALYLDNRLRNGVFSEGSLPLLEAFAGQAAVAIENARLFEAERAHRELAGALSEAAAIVNSTLDLELVLDRILEQVSRVVAGDGSNVMLIEDNPAAGATARVVRWRGYEHHPARDQIPGLCMRVADFPKLAQMTRTGKPVAVPHTLADPEWVPAEGGEWRLSYVGAPLMIAGRVAGFLNVTAARAYQLTARDAERLEAFAHHAATAIENARLYQELRARADELAATVIQLQDLDRIKTEFLQNVSHELRTPLAIIQGYTSLLESGDMGQLTPEQQQSVATICRRVRMLLDVVKDITLLLETEVDASPPEPLSLSDLARQEVAAYQEAAAQARLTLEADIPVGLPLVRGFPIHLQRVVDNLLDNAIKFTPAGGRIGVRMRQEGGQVVLQVSDTGIGISPEKQAHLFQRFYQADGSSTRRYGGMGLGLALVREVVQACGGRVSVQSEVGKGSTFTVTLPAHGKRET